MSVDIKGSKGGEQKVHTPVESPDDLRSVAKIKLLLALGEGEFQSTPTAKDIYLDDTPIQSPSGEVNFPNVKWEYRTGSVDQPYIKGMPAVENEFSVNVELKDTVQYTRAITDTNISAVKVRLRWPYLQEAKSNGDRVGTTVAYRIQVSTDGGSYQTVLDTRVTGKTTTGYERTHRIDLPESQTGWQVRVVKVTPDSTSGDLLNTMFVAGLTEVIDAKLRYPNTALLYVELDSEIFPNTPKVSVRVKGRSWPVPSNYDPESRTYSGSWDGTFKQAWTDNPVWIGYGLIVSDRFGLGKRIKPYMIDKWELYRISQYCDEMVSDGKGGFEPRFTCNVYIQNKAEAWTVLRDIASIYRGMVYWSQSQMSTLADMPREVDYTFTRSNVVDGKFTYSSTSERDIYTRAMVSYDDPDNMYESNVTVVSDVGLQKRYGDNLLELSAIGCTSESEAQRRGAWAIYTNSKSRTVSFQTGIEGALIRCGYVIGVADPLLSGRPTGGRIANVQGRTITLDRVSSAKVGDLLYVNLPSGYSQSRTITSVVEDGKVLTVSTAYSEQPTIDAQWSVESTDLVMQQYRVTKVSRDEPYLYSIEATYFDPNKFDQVDNKARREDRPISVLPSGMQSPPTNITVTSETFVEQSMSVTVMKVDWVAPPNALCYSAEWRRDDGEWISVPRISGNGFEVKGVYSGQYLVRVRAHNVLGAASLPVYSALTNIVGKTGLPPVPVNFRTTSTIFGIKLDWAFPTGALDTNYTEIQYSTNSSGEGASTLGTFAYPLNTYSMQGLGAAVSFFFRARLVDKIGNVGNWTTWVLGSSSDQASEILDYLTGQITESQLGQHLLTEIEKIDVLEGKLENIDFTEIYASIEEERNLRESEDEALAERIDTVTAIANNAGAAVQTEAAARANADGVLASNITTVQAIANGKNRTYRQASAPTANLVTGDIWYDSDDNNKVYRWNGTSWAATDDARIGTLTSAVQTETTARINGDNALAGQITTVQTTANNASASAQTALTTVNNLNGDLSTMWSVKLQANSAGQYHFAGIGLGIENTTSGLLQSQFIVRADRFAILNNNNNGTITSPFTVSGGQTFINSAVIQDASINFAKISDSIQSSNFVANSTGWKLWKNGNFEINSSIAGGTARVVINNKGLKVIQTSTNIVRIEIGELS